MTNLDAASVKANGTTKGGKWLTPLAPTEFKAWLGICLYMRVQKLPLVRHFWCASSEFFKCTVINRVMSRNRWEAILTCLHLVDNEHVVIDKTTPNNDRLTKARELVNVQNGLDATYWRAEQYLTIDEMMIPYKGRYSLGLKQYMAKKPCKWRIKLWSLANSNSQYVQIVEFYTGSQVEDSESGAAYFVVCRLLGGFEHVGHVLTCDYWFTSPALLFDLARKGIYATGTCRIDQVGWPVALTQKENAERGNVQFRMHVS